MVYFTSSSSREDLYMGCNVPSFYLSFRNVSYIYFSEDKLLNLLLLLFLLLLQHLRPLITRVVGPFSESAYVLD